jgi:DNA-binding GntR family transcriptional regulator
MIVRTDLQKPQALNAWVYDHVKSLICNIVIKPGEQINIEHLADELGVSRTPVREALLRLQQDGLVQFIPRVGCFCTDITNQDMEDIFEFREILEPYMARKATPRLTDQDLQHVRQSFQPLTQEIASGQYQGFLQSEIEFHNLLIECAGNRKIAEVMNGLNDHLLRVRVLSLSSHEHVERSFNEHIAVLEALERRDAEGAGDAMARHVRQVRERMLCFLDLPNRRQK